MNYSTVMMVLILMIKNKKIEKEKQNPKIDDNKAKQVSEFEKKELFDPNNIAALIDKSKENLTLSKRSFLVQSKVYT